MARRPDLPCASCGSLMFRGAGSLPEGSATCRPCRRQTTTYQAREAARELRASRTLTIRACPLCQETFTPWRWDQRYCSMGCRRTMQRTNFPVSTGKAKYKTKEHRDERAKWAQVMERNGYLVCAQPICVMPSRTIAAGERWHLGHDNSGTEYIGPTHMTCNVRDGARRGRARQNTTQLDW